MGKGSTEGPLKGQEPSCSRMGGTGHEGGWPTYAEPSSSRESWAGGPEAGPDRAVYTCRVVGRDGSAGRRPTTTGPACPPRSRVAAPGRV